jgi:hypothetical protein
MKPEKIGVNPQIDPAHGPNRPSNALSAPAAPLTAPLAVIKHSAVAERKLHRL